MKPFAKSLLASSISVALVGLSACSSSEQDKPDTNANVQMSGAVVDDYLAYARVYLDINDNDKFDASFERYAYTDADGYYSISKDGNTNYCADPKSSDYKHCLTIDEVATQGATVKVEGGIDILTAKVYDAAMTLVTNNQMDNQFITSVSTIDQAKAAIESGDFTEEDFSEADKAKYEAYLTTLGLSAADVTGAIPSSRANLRNEGVVASNTNSNSVDPFADQTSNALFKFAFQLNKLSEAIATDFNEVNRDPNDAKKGAQFGEGHSRSGEEIKTKDYIVPVFIALLKNMTFPEIGSEITSETDPLNLSSDQINAVYSDVETLARKRTQNDQIEAPQVKTNQQGQAVKRPVEVLNESLTTTLTVEESANPNEAPASATDKRQRSFSAEIVATTVEKVIKKQVEAVTDDQGQVDIEKAVAYISNVSAVVETIVEQSTVENESFDYDKVDFESSTDNIADTVLELSTSIDEQGNTTIATLTSTTEGEKTVLKVETKDDQGNTVEKEVNFDEADIIVESTTKDSDGNQIGETTTENLGLTVQLGEFGTTVTESLPNYALKLGEADKQEDQFELYFTATKVIDKDDGSKERAGDLLICQKEYGKTEVTPINATWSWKSSKEAVIIAESNGAVFTVTKFDATSAYCQNAQTGANTCFKVNYPDTDNPGEYASQYNASTQGLDELLTPKVTSGKTALGCSAPSS